MTSTGAGSSTWTSPVSVAAPDLGVRVSPQRGTLCTKTDTSPASRAPSWPVGIAPACTTAPQPEVEKLDSWTRGYHCTVAGVAKTVTPPSGAKPAAGQCAHLRGTRGPPTRHRNRRRPTSATTAGAPGYAARKSHLRQAVDECTRYKNERDAKQQLTSDPTKTCLNRCAQSSGTRRGHTT